MDVHTHGHTGCFSSGWIFFKTFLLFLSIHFFLQPWRNLFISWLVFSKQLESTLFNSSLALCLSIMGKLNFLNGMSQIFFRNAWSFVWFHCHSGVTAGRRLGRKIVLVPNYGHPEKSDQLCLLPDVLLQLRVEGGNYKVFRYQDDDTTTDQWCWKRFADRGLVANGMPNTRLLHQLYWRIAWYKNTHTAPK